MLYKLRHNYIQRYVISLSLESTKSQHIRDVHLIVIATSLHKLIEQYCLDINYLDSNPPPYHLWWEETGWVRRWSSHSHSDLRAHCVIQVRAENWRTKKKEKT